MYFTLNENIGKYKHKSHFMKFKIFNFCKPTK